MATEEQGAVAAPEEPALKKGEQQEQQPEDHPQLESKEPAAAAAEGEAMQGVQTQEAALNEEPVKGKAKDESEKEEEEQPKKKKKKTAESEKEEGEDDAENGEDEEEEEEPPKPKKRGRPRKESKGKNKEKENKEKDSPASPAAAGSGGDKGEVSEETPKTAGKRGRKKSEFSPPIDRPSREKKSIDRFAATMVTPRSKDVYIRKGGGTPLKDIPNVAYRLSKISKNDPILRTLHYVLFAQRSKASTVKTNLLQFSGHSWSEKDKDRAKARERLERCSKDELNSLMEILDLHLKGKKDDLCGKVFHFLEAPHATTDIVLEDKEPEKKRKGKSPGRPKKQDSDEPPKRSGKNKKRVVEEDDEDEDDESLEEEEESEQKKTYKDTDEDEQSDESDGSDKETEADSEDRPASKKRKTEGTPTKVFARKNKKEEKTRKRKEKSSSKAKTPKGKAKAKTPKGKEKKKTQNEGGDEAQSAINHPTDEDLRHHVRELLRTIDLNKASFNTVYKELGSRLHMETLEGNLKTRVKAVIKDELSKLPDEEANKEIKEDAAVVDSSKDGAKIEAVPGEEKAVEKTEDAEADKTETEKTEAEKTDAPATEKTGTVDEKSDAVMADAEKTRESTAAAGTDVEMADSKKIAGDVAVAEKKAEAGGDEKNQTEQRDEVMAES